MANQQQAELVLRRVDWNRWRKEHPEAIPELAGADFKGANLSGVMFAFPETLYSFVLALRRFAFSAEVFGSDLLLVVPDNGPVKRGFRKVASIRAVRDLSFRKRHFTSAYPKLLGSWRKAVFKEYEIVRLKVNVS